MPSFLPKIPIDPMIDCVFKKLFGLEVNKRLVIDLLNSLMGLEGSRRLVDVTFLNTFLDKNHAKDKWPVVDVLVGDLSGHSYQVEAQAYLVEDMDCRMVYDWSKIAAGSLEQGKTYLEVKHTVSIWILTENLFTREQTEEVILRFRMACPEAGLELMKESYIIVVQLSNYPGNAKISPEAERWIRFFKEGKDVNPEDPPAWAQDEVIRMAIDVIQGFSKDRLEYYKYIRAEKRQRLNEAYPKYLAKTKQALVDSQKQTKLAEKKAQQAERKVQQAERKAVLEQQKADRAERKAMLEKQKAERKVALERKKADRAEREVALERKKADEASCLLRLEREQALSREQELLSQIEALRLRSTEP